MLNQARYDAGSLSQKLAESGHTAETVTVGEVLVLLEKAIEPLLEPHRAALDAYERYPGDLKFLTTLG